MRQVMSSVSDDVEVHTAVVELLRSIFLHGSENTSISEGFLGSVRALAGTVSGPALLNRILPSLVPFTRPA